MTARRKLEVSRHDTTHMPLFDDLLRPYQREAILATRAGFRTGAKALLLNLPTGTGKTRTFVCLPKDGARILVVVPQIELVSQTVAGIRALRRMAAGIEQASNKADPGDPWVVACYPTLQKSYKKFLGKVDLVVVDECDASFSVAFRSMMKEFIAAGARVLGVTATPFRGDKASLWGFYEDCSYSMELRTAFDEAWLTKPTVNVHRVKSVDFSKLTKIATDYSPAELDLLLTSEQVLHDLAALIKEHMSPAHNLVFCGSVLQSRLMRDLLQERHNLATSLVHGKQSPEERKLEMDRFRSGEAKVIVNCAVLGRGVDIPEVAAIFNARPTKSKSRYMQVLGRGTRTLDGVLRPGMTLEERIASIKASAKPVWAMHDITSTCEHHTPITAIDVLLAGSKEIIDAVRAGCDGEPKTIEEIDAEILAAEQTLRDQEKLRKERDRENRKGLIIGVTFDSSTRDLFGKPTANSPKRQVFRCVFGKFKGLPMDSPEIPTHYLVWAVEAARLTPFWAQVYRKEIERRSQAVTAYAPGRCPFDAKPTSYRYFKPRSK